MMGYNKKSSKEPKKYLKRNGAPFTPESSTRKSPRLLLSKQLSTTREDIANDSSTDSELSPSQLSAFTSPVPADILLDDDSERSHQIIKKQGRPPKNQRKRNAATAPKYIKKHGTYYRVINVFFDEKHRQDVLCLGNTPTMCELDARKFPHKAVWDKLLDTYMDIDDDTVGSMAFKHTQFEYHGIDDNYPLTFDMLDSKQFSEVMEFLNAHYKICFNNNKVSGQHNNFDNFTQNRPYCLYYYHLWLQQVPHFRAYAVPSLRDGVAIMDRLIHVSAEDDVAKLPVQRRKGRKYGSNEFENTSKQVVDALIELSKANERRIQMTLAFQSSNAEFSRATFLVKREKELMDVVSMYREKLKEARTEVASNEVSQKCDGKEYQENVSFVEFFEAKLFEAMDALTKNSVALIQTAEEDASNHN